MIESLSKDLNKRLKYIIKEAQILDMPKTDFEEFIGAFKGVFIKWEYSVTGIKDTFKKYRNDRGSRYAFDINAGNHALTERVDQIKTLREQHENLREIFLDILTKEKLE